MGWQGCVPSGGLRGESISSPFAVSRLPVFLGSWPHTALTSASIILWSLTIQPPSWKDCLVPATMVFGPGHPQQNFYSV